MEESIEADNRASLKTAQNPDGGPFPAYPSGKSWDETSGKTGSGKKFCHSVILRTDFAAQPYSVAIIIPVIHFCMTVWKSMKIQRAWDIGFKTSSRASTQQKRMIVGGVHGSNRLGDHSLLDYAIFGRAARAACASHVVGDRVKVTSLAVLANEGKAERSKSDQAIVVGGDWI